ncbi:RTA1 like protein-domain-containing protein [Bisporella sp. PMI_857]|nr:RTA1 like protein-domain-containing protein [Bisporella sp. PMI_857]
MDDCKRITPECPVEDTTYGYYPNLAGNTVFVVVFAICAIAQVILGSIYRLKSYSILVCLGCMGEVVGYIGRIIMHSNPWNTSGFIMQSLLLIVSPSLLAAGLYLTLKHLVFYYGPRYSILKPDLYTWLFVICDAVGFVTQLVGGGVQASASNKTGSPKTRDIGNKIMIAGIVFQAATMAICGILAIDFTQKVFRHRKEERDAQRVTMPVSKKAFTFYITSTVIAFIAILIRCIYRIPEMAGGWGNALMRNEKDFMILDGAMVAIGAILMTIAFPGAFFPLMSGRNRGKGDRQIPASDYSSELQDIKPLSK